MARESDMNRHEGGPSRRALRNTARRTPGGTGRKRTVPEPMITVWDVDRGRALQVPAVVAAAGMIAYARGKLGAGTPACAVME